MYIIHDCILDTIFHAYLASAKYCNTFPTLIALMWVDRGRCATTSGKPNASKVRRADSGMALFIPTPRFYTLEEAQKKRHQKNFMYVRVRKLHWRWQQDGMMMLRSAHADSLPMSSSMNEEKKIISKTVCFLLRISLLKWVYQSFSLRMVI